MARRQRPLHLLDKVRGGAARRPNTPLPPDVPVVPANLSTTNGASNVELSWSNDPDGLASSWDVFASTSPTGGFTELASGLTSPAYTDTTAPVDAYRYYRVRAVGQGGISAWSSVVGGHRLTTIPATRYTWTGRVASGTGGAGTDDGFWTPATSGFNATSTDHQAGKSGANARHLFESITYEGDGFPVLTPGTVSVVSASREATWRGAANNTDANLKLRGVRQVPFVAPTTSAEAEAKALTTAGLDVDYLAAQVDRNNAATLYWDEDYNFWGTAANGEGIRIGTTYTGIAAYRTALDDGDNSNRIGATNYDFAADGTNPAATKIATELNGETTGDLTLVVSSAFVDTGITVPNVSDLPGVNFLGNAPDLGYAEKS